MRKNFTLLELRPSVGPSRKPGTRYVLKANLSKILYNCMLCLRAYELLGRLYMAEDKEILLAGVNTMMQIARKFLNKKSKQGLVQLLEEGSDDRQED